MANTDRLTGLDTAFLHLEDHSTAHMHVASVMIFEGRAPTPQELVDHVLGRLHLVPRYRQRLAYVPLDQGRPVWTDDPHFNPHYHIRHTALPRPGDEAALKQLAGRLFSQRLDRSKPLWEIWLVERMAGQRFALIAKTHHALVDGISGVDITTVLFDTAPEPAVEPTPPEPWNPRPLPGSAKLLGEALMERATVPAEMTRGARRMVRAPLRALGQLRDSLANLSSTTMAGISSPAPPSPLNVDIGPHRRYTWVDADLALFKAIKDSLGGTLNDVVLASVSLALGRWLREQGHDTEGLELKAMVPVSVRATADRKSHPPALGNRVAAMWAPLPVGVEDPAECLAQIQRAMENLKHSGQAVGAQVLTNLAGFAPPTILSQAARLQARQRYFNLVVTNVPGPQFPLYLLGRRLRSLYPVVPLARRQALGIAVMSYNGHLGFGLLGDYDALPDLDAIAQHLERSIRLLARAAAPTPAPKQAGSRPSAKQAGARAPAKQPGARPSAKKASSHPAKKAKASTPAGKAGSSSTKKTRPRTPTEPAPAATKR
ncbi:MAG TPA: wax ester/triacylglycerol synthase family O-acyltransferase [Solirubrobacteraceae bacterium]|jgi:diacylglycerol O-acyltransferase|nr:wax ester/triacylglycerol synthase family O-acyltransferase [Solirubrobacteraceae bacterium]